MSNYQIGQYVKCDGVVCKITDIQRNVEWKCSCCNETGTNDILTLCDIENESIVGQVLDNDAGLEMCELRIEKRGD